MVCRVCGLRSSSLSQKEWSLLISFPERTIDEQCDRIEDVMVSGS